MPGFSQPKSLELFSSSVISGDGVLLSVGVAVGVSVTVGVGVLVRVSVIGGIGLAVGESNQEETAGATMKATNAATNTTPAIAARACCVVVSCRGRPETDWA